MYIVLKSKKLGYNHRKACGAVWWRSDAFECLECLNERPKLKCGGFLSIVLAEHDGANFHHFNQSKYGRTVVIHNQFYIIFWKFLRRLIREVPMCLTLANTKKHSAIPVSAGEVTRDFDSPPLTLPYAKCPFPTVMPS